MACVSRHDHNFGFHSRVEIELIARAATACALNSKQNTRVNIIKHMMPA